MWRVWAAIGLGNLLGYGAWRLAQAALSAWWAGPSTSASGLAQAGGVLVTAILLAAPPVLIGALGAWLARRFQVGVGLACGLWSLTLIRALPTALPFIGSVWYAPTVLILLSGALGGWMLELRAQTRSLR